MTVFLLRGSSPPRLFPLVHGLEGEGYTGLEFTSVSKDYPRQWFDVVIVSPWIGEERSQG